MVKFFAIFLSVFYNIVCLGATLQVHSCGNNILWSISNTENIHDTCSICHNSTSDICRGGDCQDIELKLDQLSDKLFSNNKDIVQLFHSAIITLPWILLPDAWTSHTEIVPTKAILAYSNSSPPTYLLHCTFRI
jgi:hypothetical protein